MELKPIETGRNGGTTGKTKKVPKPLKYKIVELSNVTDEVMEEQLNHWSRRGWNFESIHFVVRENSRRPAMAFLFFVRDWEDEDEGKA